MGPILTERGLRKALRDHGPCRSWLASESGPSVTLILDVPPSSLASQLLQGAGLWQQNDLVTAALTHFGITLQAFGQWRLEQPFGQRQQVLIEKPAELLEHRRTGLYPVQQRVDPHH